MKRRTLLSFTPQSKHWTISNHQIAVHLLVTMSDPSGCVSMVIVSPFERASA